MKSLLPAYVLSESHEHRERYCSLLWTLLRMQRNKRIHFRIPGESKLKISLCSCFQHSVSRKDASSLNSFPHAHSPIWMSLGPEPFDWRLFFPHSLPQYLFQPLPPASLCALMNRMHVPVPWFPSALSICRLILGAGYLLSVQGLRPPGHMRMWQRLTVPGLNAPLSQRMCTPREYPWILTKHVRSHVCWWLLTKLSIPGELPS